MIRKWISFTSQINMPFSNNNIQMCVLHTSYIIRRLFFFSLLLFSLSKYPQRAFCCRPLLSKPGIFWAALKALHWQKRICLEHGKSCRWCTSSRMMHRYMPFASLPLWIMLTRTGSWTPLSQNIHCYKSQESCLHEIPTFLVGNKRFITVFWLNVYRISTPYTWSIIIVVIITCFLNSTFQLTLNCDVISIHT